MVNKLSAYKTYLLFSAITAMCFSLVATVMIVYHIETVHLNPLQLILVGTTLEVACFIFEIPTGIVADVYSRKLSIVIGVVLTGVGFILEGSISSFVFVLVAQIVWGLGSTFISGSVEAWIAEEEKDKDLDKIKIVFTTTSLAPKPVINATDILQSLNPNGAKIGAIALPK